MNKSTELMGSAKINGLMAKMSVPAIIAQVINILYSIVDRIYIGHIPGIGVNALTGVGVTLPIIVFISAFSSFVGAGGAPLSAISEGAGNRERAEKILGNGVMMLLVFSAALMVAFYIFNRPLLMAFGSSNATITYAQTYINIYLIGTVFVELALGLNQYIIAQGKPVTGMLSILIGAIANIILDPIFIFVFDLGVAGAAIATIISQALSAVWVVGFLISKKAVLKIRIKNLKPDFKIIKNVCALGISPFVMRSTESLLLIVLNHGLQIYGGDLYVGSLTVMQSVMQFFTTPLQGFTQGVQPIISYNFGAGKFDRVRSTYRRMIGVCTVFSLITTLIVLFFPEFFAEVFSKDAELISLVESKLPIYMFGMLLFGFQMGIQPTFMALGQAKISLFIAALRKVILLIPLALILPMFFGVDGIYFAEPISDIISALIALTLFTINIKKILTNETLSKLR